MDRCLGAPPSGFHRPGEGEYQGGRAFDSTDLSGSIRSGLGAAVEEGKAVITPVRIATEKRRLARKRQQKVKVQLKRWAASTGRSMKPVVVSAAGTFEKVGRRWVKQEAAPGDQRSDKSAAAHAFVLSLVNWPTGHATLISYFFSDPGSHLV